MICWMVSVSVCYHMDGIFTLRSAGANVEKWTGCVPTVVGCSGWLHCCGMQCLIPQWWAPWWVAVAGVTVVKCSGGATVMKCSGWCHRGEVQWLVPHKEEIAGNHREEKICTN